MFKTRITINYHYLFFFAEKIDELVEAGGYWVGVSVVWEVGEVGTVDKVFLVALLVADNIEGFVVEECVYPSLLMTDGDAWVQFAYGEPEVCCQVGDEGMEGIGVGDIEVCSDQLDSSRVSMCDFLEPFQRVVVFFHSSCFVI